MHILFYILILFAIACNPQESPDPPKPSQNNQQMTKPKSPKPSQNNQSKKQKPPSSPSSEDKPAGDKPVTSSHSMANSQDANTSEAPEPSPTEVQWMLMQMDGVYEFKLDVYQNWNHFLTTFLKTNVPISLKLVQNFRPQKEQLLIEVISTEPPYGKFCVVQSDFVFNEKTLEARHSISNKGRIVDINTVKNTVIIDTYDPLHFILEFTGDHGSESVEINAGEDSILDSENFSHDFDSLCQFCGFQIGPEGLCQEKKSTIFEDTKEGLKKYF